MEIVTPLQAKKLGLGQLYEWSDPQEKIKTGKWGTITIAEWLHYEADRINADPTRTARVVQAGSQRTLYVNLIINW